MFYQFLEDHREELLAMTEEKTLKLAGDLPSSLELRRGLPVFLDHLIAYLKGSNMGASEDKIVQGPQSMEKSSCVLITHYPMWSMPTVPCASLSPN